MSNILSLSVREKQQRLSLTTVNFVTGGNVGADRSYVELLFSDRNLLDKETLDDVKTGLTRVLDAEKVDLHASKKERGCALRFYPRHGYLGKTPRMNVIKLLVFIELVDRCTAEFWDKAIGGNFAHDAPTRTSAWMKLRLGQHRPQGYGG